MIARLMAAMLASTLAACGPPPPPAFITQVQDLAAGKAAQKAREKAPSEYKKGMDVLDAAIEAHADGDEQTAMALAQEASILLKTAVAVARQKTARGRILRAQQRMEDASGELERFTALRLDTQQRFLSLSEFHDEQSDLAETLRSRFEADKDTLSKLTDAQKDQWLDSERERLGRVLAGARSTELAARALGCATLLPSESLETASALDHAHEALDEDWTVLRPLVDDASLRADRLLVHTRAMHQPQPLANPAQDDEALKRILTAMKGTDAMVSGTRRGILVSLHDPWDAKGSTLTQPALQIIETLAGATGSGATPLVVEAWMMEGCADQACLDESAAAAQAARDALVQAGEPAADVTVQGWGDAPIGAEGHCLASPCPQGRLDIVILAL